MFMLPPTVAPLRSLRLWQLERKKAQKYAIDSQFNNFFFSLSLVHCSLLWYFCCYIIARRVVLFRIQLLLL